MTKKLLAMATGLVATTGLIVASAWAGPGLRPASREDALLRPAVVESLPFKPAATRQQEAAARVEPAAVGAVPVKAAGRSKLSAELEAQVAAGNRTEQKYDVVVVTAGDPAEVARQLGGAEVKQTYRRAVQGFAARLTAEQVLRLRAMAGVEAVGTDETVHTMVDSAARWTGVTKLREDFGITADGDGFEQRYSTRDVVIAVVDTGMGGEWG